jgi:hypothetical protein
MKGTLNQIKKMNQSSQFPLDKLKKWNNKLELWINDQEKETVKYFFIIIYFK